jgi:ubiquinone/menaquinone biosynthesis C-methylase UbiE
MERPLTGNRAERFDRLAERYGKPFFESLWVRAWGEQYPTEVQPHSSCTRDLLRQLVDVLALRPRQVLADLGCGTGGVGLWLARELNVSLRAIDCSPLAIEIANQRIHAWGLSGSADARIGYFSATGLDAGSVDAAVSVDALPFAEDVDAALRETRRILRSGGMLSFTTRELRPGSPSAARFGRTWEKALRRNGLEPVRIICRPEVSGLWRSVYREWVAHEQDLRSELPGPLVDDLLAEVDDIAPRLDDDRKWLLITAAALS